MICVRKKPVARNELCEKLLKIREFCDALGLTEAAVRRWISTRRIATVKVGRLVRIPNAELQRIIQIGLRPARDIHAPEK